MKGRIVCKYGRPADERRRLPRPPGLSSDVSAVYTTGVLGGKGLGKERGKEREGNAPAAHRATRCSLQRMVR